MIKKAYLLIFALIIIISSIACQPKGNDIQHLSELKVITHDSFAVSEGLIAEFEAANNAKVSFIQSGDTGSALNRVILTKDFPLADIFYGVDNTYLTRAFEADIFDPYESDDLKNVDKSITSGVKNLVTPIDFGDVCINYDKNYFEENNLIVPSSFEDLLKPEYENLLVVENPSTSSPGLAFLLSTIAYFGPDGYLQYWQDLKANGLVVANDWETAYYSNFSGSSGQGLQPLVVSYGSSPPAEVIFSESVLDEAPTASIVADNMCFRQIEYAGILKGTENRDLAEKFIDFMLSTSFQEEMPLQMFVFPVNTQAQLPQEFIDYAQIPEQPASIDPADVSKYRDTWIQEWNNTVLK